MPSLDAADAVLPTRPQAQILSLERQNAELQKRLADVQAALEAAQQGRHALEAKNDMLLDEVAQVRWTVCKMGWHGRKG